MVVVVVVVVAVVTGMRTSLLCWIIPVYRAHRTDVATR